MMWPRTTKDALTVWLLRAAAGCAGGIILLILGFLTIESIPGFRAIGLTRFFTDHGWYPTAQADHGAFNLAPMIVVSLVTTLGAVLLAGPVGIGSAVFCRFYAPGVTGDLYRRALELLAGIPSVVYGLWGIVTLAPILQEIQPPGQCLLAGILILAIMILPTIALLADAAIGRVPPSFLCASAAVALTRWSMIRRVVLPAARPGLAIALILGVARAIGETMAVLMVCGNIVQVPTSLFDPVRTLTANIALELGYAMGDQRSALFVSGLFLLMMVFGLVWTAESFKEKANHA